MYSNFFIACFYFCLFVFYGYTLISNFASIKSSLPVIGDNVEKELIFTASLLNLDPQVILGLLESALNKTTVLLAVNIGVNASAKYSPTAL
jgi:hypothetical protein